MWAHIRTIQLCLTLQQYYYGREDWEYDALLDTYRTQHVPHNRELYDIRIADKERITSVQLTRKRHASVQELAEQLRHEVIQRNIRGLSYHLQRLDGKDQPRLVFSALIEVAYWHLSQMAQRQVKECAGCGSLFIVQHGKQQYCPHRDPSKPSPCAVKTRQRRNRQKKRVHIT
jgi:hypothetical protein